MVAMVYTTTLTILSWTDEVSKAPGYCDNKGSVF